MDELEMRVEFAQDEVVDEDSFLVKNLWIEGIKWSKKGFELSDEISHHLKNIKFKWIKCKLADAKTLKKDEIFVPLYLNSSRQNLLMPIKFKIDSSIIDETQMYQRGICFIAWKM